MTLGIKFYIGLQISVHRYRLLAQSNVAKTRKTSSILSLSTRRSLTQKRTSVGGVKTNGSTVNNCVPDVQNTGTAEIVELLV
jgi:hypothetical protein